MNRDITVNLPELIQYLTWLASEREEMLSPIRWVKSLTEAISPAVATGKGAT
jgi:hypothetical protein